jgi:hypothetical protein
VGDDERVRELREKLQAQRYKDAAKKEHELIERQRRATRQTKLYLLILGFLSLGFLVAKWFPHIW